MPEKSQQPKRSAKVFDVSWERDDDQEDAARAVDDDDSDDDDFEGHATNFHRPASS